MIEFVAQRDVWQTVENELNQRRVPIVRFNKLIIKKKTNFRKKNIIDFSISKIAGEFLRYRTRFYTHGCIRRFVPTAQRYILGNAQHVAQQLTERIRTRAVDANFFDLNIDLNLLKDTTYNHLVCHQGQAQQAASVRWIYRPIL